MVGQARAGESFGELSQLGFQLAYFIVRDRQAAIQILSRAWNKLDARIKQQTKRTYWRDKYLKRWVSKITKTDSDTLQWLIYFESEEYENREEQTGAVTTETLVIRYIKSVVKTTTAMSSFYVAVGIHRLLHDYSTAEVQRVYELVTDRYMGADEYRRAKRFLMNSLALRFGNRLKSVRSAHGEIRFELFEDQAFWGNLVNQCLNVFTPWSTRGRCPVPSDFGAEHISLPPALSGSGKSSATLDNIETNRCHAFIDMSCYRRLVRALGIDLPEHRLALPKFQADNAGRQDEAHKPSSELPALTSEERETIRESLADEAKRRKRAASQTTRVLVDGIEVARIVMGRQSETQFQLAEGAKLVEFWGQDTDGELLLGTYLIQYSESSSVAASRATLSLGRATLTIEISADEGQPASLTVVLRPPALAARAFAAGETTGVRFPVRAVLYAFFAMILISAGWTLRWFDDLHNNDRHNNDRHEKDRQDLSAQNARIEQLQREIAEASSTSSLTAANRGIEAPAVIVKRLLVPYDRGTRGGNADPITIVSLPPRSEVVQLELPVGLSSHRAFRAVLRTFPQQTELLNEQLDRPVTPGTPVVFSIPIALLSDGKDYLVELMEIHSSGASEPVSTFAFHAVKTSE